jgi:hypothetical protein
MAIVREVSHDVDPPMVGSAPFNWHVEMDTRRVVRGKVPEQLRVNGWGSGCSFLRTKGLSVGDQIFVTLDRLNLAKNPSLYGRIVIWQRTDHGWRFAEDALAGGSNPANWPSDAREARSMTDIRAIVHGRSLPDTAALPGVSQDRGVPLLPLAAGLAAVLILSWRLPHRLTGFVPISQPMGRATRSQ